MDINLIKETYKRLPSDKLITIALKERQQLGDDALKVLEEELSFRDIDIEAIARFGIKGDEELIDCAITEKSVPISTITQIYLEKELNKRFATELNDFDKYYSPQELINIIKNHRLEVDIIDPIDIKLLIYSLKLKKLTPSLAEEFKMVLTSDLEFLSKKSAEVNNLPKVQEAGKALKNIGVYLTNYLISQLLVTIGVVLTFFAGRTISPFFLIIYGIASLIVVVRIIAQFYDAGNALLSITKDPIKEENQ